MPAAVRKVVVRAYFDSLTYSYGKLNVVFFCVPWRFGLLTSSRCITDLCGHGLTDWIDTEGSEVVDF